MTVSVVTELWVTQMAAFSAVSPEAEALTTGVSTGREPGTRLTAWIHYSDREGLGVGTASIIVQEDGTF